MFEFIPAGGGFSLVVYRNSEMRSHGAPRSRPISLSHVTARRRARGLSPWHGNRKGVLLQCSLINKEAFRVPGSQISVPLDQTLLGAGISAL